MNNSYYGTEFTNFEKIFRINHNLRRVECENENSVIETYDT